VEIQEKKPKVSVCVVTYNQEKYIRQCLQSLVDQETNFDFEVIVADDCSMDDTRAIVREFAEKFPTIINPVFHRENIGAARNFLTTHSMARGKYVAHMDGDDYALPGKLQAQANILDSKLECTVVWHRVDYFDDAGRFCSGKTSDLSLFDNGKVHFEEAIRVGFIGAHSSLMYRRSAREAVSLDRKLLDIYFTWDLLSKGSGHILNEVLGGYRIAASGALTVSSSPQICRLAIKHAEHFLKKYPEQRKNFVIWSITNAIVDAKNARLTVFNFLSFALRNFSIVSPREIFLNLINIRKIRVRWNQMDSFYGKEN
jgi:glycosyltransferase involved in cell wall biosynthesis